MKKQLPSLHLETPYEPNMWKSSGAYRINVGRHFYLGSTMRLGPRISDHRVKLERGEHPNRKLQAAWTGSRSFSATVLEEMPRKSGEPDKDFIQRLKLHEQWLLDEHFGTGFCCNLSSESGFNSGISDIMKAKWADPEFRAKQMPRFLEMRSRKLTEETRAKMSAAKSRGNHHAARPCTVHCDGEWRHFACVTDAAEHFKVSQQQMYGWVSGTFLCPGNPCFRKSSRSKETRRLMAAFDEPKGDGGREYNARYFMEAVCGPVPEH